MTMKFLFHVLDHSSTMIAHFNMWKSGLASLVLLLLKPIPTVVMKTLLIHEDDETIERAGSFFKDVSRNFECQSPFEQHETKESPLHVNVVWMELFSSRSGETNVESVDQSKAACGSKTIHNRRLLGTG